MADERTKPGHFHAVRFYEDDASLCRIVCDFIREGFAGGQPAVVIATTRHRAGIGSRLEELSLDVKELEASGLLTFFDAGATLARFMVDGMPNTERFTEAMTEILENASPSGERTTIRAYGEMVDLLWQAGLHAASIRLEMLWNQLANTKDFSLLCGYSMGSFYKDAAYEEICHEHSHIISIEGEAAPLS
jgi:hypothetical protein